MEILVILAIIVSGGAGFYFGRNNSPDSKEKIRLETELKQRTDELESFQNKVTNHFEKTANLFNQVSDSYQTLYDHMAKSSSQLCSSQTFKAMPKSTKDRAASAQTIENGQTKKEVFNADALYNAYDYRNKLEQTDELVTKKKTVDTPKKKVNKDNKVVDIVSAKEDKNAPALDYAIKDKGIINHNSLNIDDVKTS